MIVLDSSPRSLEVQLGGAVATRELTWDCSWVDYDPAGPSYGPGAASGLTTGTSPVTVAPAPGAGVTRHVKRLAVQEGDTAPVTLTVQVNQGGTPFAQYTLSLSPGDTLEYDDGRGPVVLTGAGAAKVTTAGGGTAAVVDHPFSYGDASPVGIVLAAAGKVVKSVQLYILTAFDGVGAALQVGDVGSPGRLMAAGQNDPAAPALYEVWPDLAYGADTPVILTITPGAGATHGRALLTIEMES